MLQLQWLKMRGGVVNVGHGTSMFYRWNSFNWIKPNQFFRECVNDGPIPKQSNL